MVFLGVIVAVVAVVAGIELVVQNSSSASLEFFGHGIPGVHTEAQVLMVGAVVAFVVFGGFAVSVAALLRNMRVRRELHDLRDERQESIATLEMKNQQLQRELTRLRGGPATDEAPVSPDRHFEREPVSPFFDHPA